MIAATGTPTLRATGSVGVGCCVAALASWRTGLVSAVPSAVGLTVLAASDLASRRVPKPVVRTTAVLTVLAGVIDSLRAGSAHRFLVACGVTLIATLVAALVWLVTHGIAFGDVKLIGLASFVPAWLRGTAVTTMIVATLFAAVGMIGIERLRTGRLDRDGTIPFGPPLLVGWLVGVLTA